MKTKISQICCNCVLPDTFPGISFDSTGRCNFCKDDPSVKDKFLELKNIMDIAIESRKSFGRYDCVVAYSGGKDSTFTLKLLIETYGLKCLAVTIDNGFISEQAKKNCDAVTSMLGVDHFVFKPSTDFMNNMFVQSVRNKDIHSNASIKRASCICNSCINLINIQMIKFALQNDVPIVAGGYIGGQVPKDAAIMDIDLSMLNYTRKAMQSKYQEYLGEIAMKYMQLPVEFLERSLIKKLLIINPMLTVKATEEKIINEIKPLGWTKTSDTGNNSSNCRLNDLGIAIHYHQYGFNPYVFEISEQIRNGLIDRDTALEKVNYIPEFADVLWQAQRIGLNLNDI